MAIRTYDILLDSYNSTIPEPIVGRQGDKNGAVTLHVAITDRGTAVDLTGQTINLMAETAKGTAIVADNSGVTLTDAVNGKFDYAIPNSLWIEAGKITKAYFSLNDTDGQETTYDLIFIVKKAIDISQNKADDYVTIIDGTLRDLKTKVDAIYADFSAGNFYNKNQVDTFVDDLKTSISDASNTNVYESELFGGSVKSEDINTLSAMNQELDTSKFNFVFMTDIHFGRLSNLPTKPTNYTLQHVANANYFGNVDATVLGGDNTDGSTIPLAALISDVRQMAAKFMYGGLTDVDRFTLLGNHDDGSLRTDSWVSDGKRYEFPGSISENQLANYYHTVDCIYGEKRVNGSFYFYKDYPDKKIRLIGLNSDDMPEDILNPDGSQKYSRQHHLGYRQEQLNWLANTALANWPAGYTAVVMSHVALEGDASGVEGETNFNFGTLQQILSAFKNGENKTVTGTTPNFEINVTTNFSQQGPQPIAGLFHGHWHKESYSQISGINDIGMTSSLPGIDPTMTDSDAFVIITIDTKSRKINIKGFGRATDRQFDY